MKEEEVIERMREKERERSGKGGNKVLHELHIHSNKRVTRDRFRFRGKESESIPRERERIRKYQKKERELTHEASSGSIFIVSVFTIKGSVTFERKIDARSIVTIELGSSVALFCITIGKHRTS